MTARIRVFEKWTSSRSTWKVRVGCDPASVPAPAVILFPLCRSTFFCGLAGIVVIKEKAAVDEIPPDEKLRRCCEKIRAKDLDALMKGQIGVSDYLDGTSCLHEMEKAIDHLKQNDACREVLCDPAKAQGLQELLRDLKTFFAEEERRYDQDASCFATADAEIINARMTLMRDILWVLEKDILENISRIAELSVHGGCLSSLGETAFNSYNMMNYIMNSLDRLEVRGRDSAGVQVSLTLPDRDAFDGILSALKTTGLYGDFLTRSNSGDLANGTITLSVDPEGDDREQDGPVSVSFTYKTFSIIGELGRNVKALRKDVSADEILRVFAASERLFETTLAHTRWASVGSITEENCHPVNNYSPTSDRVKHYGHYGARPWSINVVLNGDIDNYQTLRKSLEDGKSLIAPEVTTDTKIIPLVIEKYLFEGHDLKEAFRRGVGDFEGSHAIAMTSDAEPGKVFLALRGSGQAVYVGIADDAYVFSSELYGLIERTPRFIKMDGEKLPRPEDTGLNGQIFVLDQSGCGGTAGISALYYDGTPLALTDDDIQRAEMTTRDIDRRNYPHFFLKEISEASRSVRKTLQGKYRLAKDGAVTFNFGEDILPQKIRQALLSGSIRNIVVIGHGTAAVAGTAIADGWIRYLQGTAIRIEAKVASELSGFSLREDLSDTLVIPITQSGTTTDTNRAVAMARDRGASIIAIVNRRQSDITAKSHGVFYTSDGRDIEMSVASTKAFYSQIVAGHLLGLGLAQLLGLMPDRAITEELHCLEAAPEAMERVMARGDLIQKSVALLAKGRQYWAIVGSGPNKAAADEIRIKLSELCYKTISSDVIENKKHIDLSAEPLIIVCAAGNPETVVGDIVKDVAIFRAHKAGVVVFADEGEERFNGIADAVIPIPKAPLPLPVILNTVAGHLWGYYAACSIDEDARFFREFRNKLHLALAGRPERGGSFYEMMADREFRRTIREFAVALNKRRQENGFAITNGNILSDLLLLLKYAVGRIPMEDFWEDFQDEGADFSPLDRLDICLGQAIDELSRPIDAIRHQAKTVTVGTSRKEQLLPGIVFSLLGELDFSIRQLAGKNVLDITRIQSAIEAVKGYTLYEVHNLDADGNPSDASTIGIVKRGGVSLSMVSRAEKSRSLMGTKRTLTSTGHVYVGQGKLDGAPIVIIPLLGGGEHSVRNLLLIHVSFLEALPIREKIDILGYKYNDIQNLINEYNLPWDDGYLESLSVERLLSDPAEVIAGRIRSSL